MVMANLSTPLSEVIRQETAEWFALDLGIFTVAELLAHFPYGYEDPPPTLSIRDLRDRTEAVVRALVTHNERRLVDLARYSRRVRITVTHIVDGSGELELLWVDRRSDVSGGLTRGRDVVVRGVPFLLEQGRFRPPLRRMWDPEIKALDPTRPSKWLDAPIPLFGDSVHLEGARIGAAAVVALQDAWSEIGQLLRRVLRGLFDPATTEERDYGWQHRNWALMELNKVKVSRPTMPQPRLIKTPRDAGRYARDVLAALGFAATVVTPEGREGGIDVLGRDVVAQVKLEGVKTDAPKLQAFSGIASHERKNAAFFSLAGYTKAARDWAEHVGMALFEYDYTGGVQPRSPYATRLLTMETSEPQGPPAPPPSR